MKTLVKTLIALCVTALCLTSDSASSSTVPASPVENLSSNSSVCAATIPTPKSSASPNWLPTACIPPKQ